MPNAKECLKPHALVHNLVGIGIGLVLAGLIPGLTGGTGVTVGVVLVVLGVIGEFAFNRSATAAGAS